STLPQTLTTPVSDPIAPTFTGSAALETLRPNKPKGTVAPASAAPPTFRIRRRERRRENNPDIVASKLGHTSAAKRFTHSECSAPHRGVCLCILKAIILAEGELGIRLFCAPVLRVLA